ncbi:MAG: hypothetical protein EOO61_08610 [Hymenobacter sp.]|nr:MAG: hypothetical protein EOO61_08610 [Hymenobacter sp.]
MQPHILTIPDDGVYEQLVQLVAAAGLHIADNGLVSKPVQINRIDASQPVLSNAERQHHLAVIARGGSGTSITDPVAWQREIRQDRPLPGRD